MITSSPDILPVLLAGDFRGGPSASAGDTAAATGFTFADALQLLLGGSALPVMSDQVLDQEMPNATGGHDGYGHKDSAGNLPDGLTAALMDRALDVGVPLPTPLDTNNDVTLAMDTNNDLTLASDNDHSTPSVNSGRLISTPVMPVSLPFAGSAAGGLAAVPPVDEETQVQAGGSSLQQSEQQGNQSATVISDAMAQTIQGESAPAGASSSAPQAHQEQTGQIAATSVIFTETSTPPRRETKEVMPRPVEMQKAPGNPLERSPSPAVKSAGETDVALLIKSKVETVPADSGPEVQHRVSAEKPSGPKVTDKQTSTPVLSRSQETSVSRSGNMTEMKTVADLLETISASAAGEPEVAVTVAGDDPADVAFETGSKAVPPGGVRPRHHSRGKAQSASSRQSAAGSSVSRPVGQRPGTAKAGASSQAPPTLPRSPKDGKVQAPKPSELSVHSDTAVRGFSHSTTVQANVAAHPSSSTSPVANEHAPVVTPPRFILNVPRPLRIPGQIRVQMNPPFLGHIRIDLVASRNGIIGTLRIKSDHVRQAVKNDLGQLHKALADAGVRVERIDITAGPSGSPRHAMNPETSGRNHWSQGSNPEQTPRDSSQNNRHDGEDVHQQHTSSHRPRAMVAWATHGSVLSQVNLVA